MHKEVIKHVATIVRRNLQAEKSAAEDCVLLSLSSLARLVLANKTKTVQRLLRTSDLTKRHLTIVDHRVEFVDSSAFDAELSTQKSRTVDERKDLLERLWELDAAKDTKNKISAIETRSKLWEAGAKKLVLTAVITDDDSNYTNDKDEMIDELRVGWRPVFTCKPDADMQKIAFDKLRPFVQSAGTLWSSLPPPSSIKFTARAAAASPTKPGPDNVPYS